MSRTAQKLAMVEEVWPEHLRHSENPLGVPNLSNHLLHQVRAEDPGTLGGARRAERPRLTRERHQKLGRALRTPDPGEAAAEVATVGVRRHDPVQEAPPTTVEPLETLLPAALDLFVEGLDKAVQRRRPGISRTIGLRRACFGHRMSTLSQRGRSDAASPSGRYMSTVAEIEVVALWAPTISTRLVVSNQIGRRQKSLKSLYGLRRNES
jgi:hypothetical protein